MYKLVTKYSYSGLSGKGYYNEPFYINLLTRTIKLNYQKPFINYQLNAPYIGYIKK